MSTAPRGAGASRAHSRASTSSTRASSASRSARSGTLTRSRGSLTGATLAETYAPHSAAARPATLGTEAIGPAALALRVEVGGGRGGNEGAPARDAPRDLGDRGPLDRGCG